MSSTSLSFQFTPLSLTVTVMALAAVCGLSWFAWLRSGRRPAIAGLELLRVGIVGLILVLLNQPETVQTFAPTELPCIAVLVDQSRSMQTRDVRMPGSSESLIQDRQSAAQPLLDDKGWETVSQRFNVIVSPFASDQERGLTNIHQALSQAQSDHPSLKAIVLISDGDWNDGPPPVEAATPLRAAQIPIFSVPLGSPSRLPDIDLVGFDVPTFGVVGKNVRVPITIESSLPRDHVVQVELKVSDGATIHQQVHIKAMGRTSEQILWKPETIGDYTLRLTIPEHPDEILSENNWREAPMAIREEKLKVLVIESVPRWEYRFLRNALSRDPGVDVHCLLFHPGLGKVGGGNQDYISSFPESLEQLAQYDVVFLGDVGVQEGQLTSQQAELLKGLVEQQASGLVFMPGIKGYQLSLVDSALEPLLPVVLDTSQPMGWGSREASQYALTELGRNSLLTKLADTADDNLQVWDALPGFQWYASVIRAKAGTDVLALHREASNQFGRIPLLVTRTFGAGKILFMGTDGAWRWRRGVEDRYHYRFWGQVVRWMAYQRNMAKGELMRLYYSPEQPQVRQTVALSANITSTGGEPLSQGTASARIVAPSGHTKVVQFSSSGDQWGAFAGQFTPSEPGTHQVVLSCQENDAELKAQIFVQGRSLEQIGRPVRLDVMEELARISRGKMIQDGRLAELLQAIESIADSPPAVRRVALWSHPWAAALLVTMLAALWIGRKVVGVI
ncbi:MAG: VWA domain-containing protein [Pirellulaceae bacterium]|nr:VWA domain-containing protein [Pirellulaceae bacterium]